MLTQRSTGTVLGTSIEISDIEQTCQAVIALAREQRPAYVCFATAHMLVEASREQSIGKAYRQATMIAADGTPVAWCLRMKGHRLATCVSGPRTMPRLLEEASRQGLRVGFYGGRQETLDRMKEKLGMAVANLQIVYSCSPPFRNLTEEEQQLLLKGIADAEVQLLFVGLGSPKQERWMQEFSPSLRCVCLGVGAAFEFLSGEKILPPLWVQKLGMTWFVRLCQEPRRLARRNLVSFVFLGKFAKELAEETLFRRSGLGKQRTAPSLAATREQETAAAHLRFGSPLSATPANGTSPSCAASSFALVDARELASSAHGSGETKDFPEMLPSYTKEQSPLAEMPL